MNLRDREFPDRRGARREARPRSGRAAAGVRSRSTAALLQPGPGTGAVANADVVAQVKSMPMQVLKGQAVSAGIAIGPVVVLDLKCGMRLPPTLDHAGAGDPGRARTARPRAGLRAGRGQPGRDRGPGAARPPVCRHLGGSLPDDHRPDLTAPTRARSSKKSIPPRSTLYSTCSTSLSADWNSSPARICRPEPPTCVTSRRGS